MMEHHLTGNVDRCLQPERNREGIGPREMTNARKSETIVAVQLRRPSVPPFDQDRRFFRLGFAWPTPEELRRGLQASAAAVAAARR